MQWHITRVVDGVEKTATVTADDLPAANVKAAALAKREGSVLLTVIRVDDVAPTDPTLQQSPDGSWWRMGVSDTGDTTWSPVD